MDSASGLSIEPKYQSILDKLNHWLQGSEPDGDDFGLDGAGWTSSKAALFKHSSTCLLISALDIPEEKLLPHIGHLNNFHQHFNTRNLTLGLHRFSGERLVEVQLVLRVSSLSFSSFLELPVQDV
jgi:hypothetical protein